LGRESTPSSFIDQVLIAMRAGGMGWEGKAPLRVRGLNGMPLFFSGCSRETSTEWARGLSLRSCLCAIDRTPATFSMCRVTYKGWQGQFFEKR